MSDNKLNPEELELREGEHHELLGEPAELFEISAPEEVVLLDTIHEELQALPREDGVTSVAPIGGVVVNEDSTLIESIPEDTPEPVRVESLELSPLVDIEETDPSLFDSITEPSVTTPEPIEVISEDASISPIIITEPYPEPVIAVTPTEELESAVVNVVGETEVPPESPQSQDSVPVVTPSEDVISERAPAMAAPIIPPMIQPKSNKILIVSGIVGACVLIGGAIVWAIQNNNSTAHIGPSVEYTISAESGTATYQEMLQAQVQQASDDVIIMNRALAESDATLCQAIVSDAMILECNEMLLARSISSSGTLADCQSLTRTDIRSTCESTLSQKEALSTMNKVICNNITDDIQSQYCRESIDEKVLMSLIETKTATGEKCRQLEEKHQSACLASIVVKDDNSILQNAVQNDSLEDCKTLSTEELQYTCFDTILLKRALASKDKNLCDYVRDETKKTTCVSYTSTQDDNETFKSAIIDKNLNACLTIQSESLKNRCLDSVTLLIVRDTKDASLCDTLISTGTVDSCKKSVGAQ